MNRIERERARHHVQHGEVSTLPHRLLDRSAWCQPIPMQSLLLNARRGADFGVYALISEKSGPWGTDPALYPTVSSLLPLPQFRIPIMTGTPVSCRCCGRGNTRGCRGCWRRCRRGRATAGDHCRLHDLTERIENDVDKRPKWAVFVCFLR